MKAKKITKNTLIADIIQAVPEATQILVEEYGIFCAGCHMAPIESIGDGAKGHGLTKQELTQLLKKLNQMVKK